ncbi:MAG: hypothetical protein ACM32O_05640, partial [Clostridia bacterium]
TKEKYTMVNERAVPQAMAAYGHRLLPCIKRFSLILPRDRTVRDDIQASREFSKSTAKSREW